MSNATFIQEVVNLTNQFRAQKGLAPLSIDLDLNEAAQNHTEDMAFNDYFSHYGLNSSKPWDRAQAAGYETGIVGENIGMGYASPKAVVNAWIKSDSHRAAMLNSRYNEIGVGYYYLANDTGRVNYNSYWTQLFGQGDIEADSASTAAAAPPPPFPGFDPLQYAASNPDLLVLFNTDTTALTQHYVTYGANEGRPTDTFDEMGYLASNPDLLRAFGANGSLATQHYIMYGYTEGRTTSGFQPWQYLASYDDLIRAFGPNPVAATQHFIQNGFGEGRAVDLFDEGRYLASNADLIQHLGYDLEAATQHYVTYGLGEGRAKTAFDPAAYLARYGDLQAVFGGDLVGSTQHYIEFGFHEGRIAT
jgi:hypothetical protein